MSLGVRLSVGGVNVTKYKVSIKGTIGVFLLCLFLMRPELAECHERKFMAELTPDRPEVGIGGAQNDLDQNRYGGDLILSTTSDPKSLNPILA